ncbi:hypothetical protein M434DRAFT_161673 [Hypoxylon sp. CO27-5]|nr:hypothetical protein M434DRAFT_161673 [Hypoxylon sp. CO27-5]
MPPIRSLRYDSDTGQSYCEWFAEIARQNRTEWYREQPLDHDQAQSSRGVKGVPSLVDICVKVVAKHISTCEVEDYESVPPHLTWRICEYMDKTHMRMPMQAFKIFTEQLSQDHWGRRKLRTMPTVFFKSRHTVERMPGPLSHYTNVLASASFNFIVRLTLCGRDLSINTHDLLGLTGLKNLGVLEIVHPGPLEETPNFPRVTDAVIREWAREPDAFPVLRVLRIWGEDFTTIKSIPYLSSFPSLAIYDVAGRRSDWHDDRKQPVEDFGWSSDEKDYSLAAVFLSLSDKCTLFNSKAAYSCSEALNLMTLESNLIASEQPPTRKRRRGAQTFELESAMSEDALFMIEVAVERAVKLSHMKGRGDPQDWGYLLYCYIGQLRSDGDLIAQVSLGRASPAKKIDRVYERYRTFARMEYGARSYEQQPPSGSESFTQANSAPRMRKRQKVFSMFDL